MSSKIIEMTFFCNVIIFYCFLELLETPTVFFLKKLILGQCYTLVHQNCATDLSDFYCFHFSGHSYFYHFNYIFHLKNIYFRRTRNDGITTYLCFVFSFQVKKQNFMEIIAFDLQNFAFVTYSFIQRKLQCYCFSKSQYKNSPSKHIFFLQVKSSQTLFWQQGYTLRKIEGSHVL